MKYNTTTIKTKKFKLLIFSFLLLFTSFFSLATMSHAQQPLVTRPPSLNTSTSPQVAGVSYSSSQILAIFFVVLIFIVGFIILTIIIRKGLEAMGRNPLNTSNIKRSMILSFLVILLALGMGLFIAYLIFNKAPTPEEQQVRIPPTPAAVIEVQENGNVHTTSCFTVAIPFETSYPKINLKEGACTLTFSIKKPLKGEFTLSHYPNPPHTNSTNPSITMRNLYSDQYHPIEVSNSNFPTILAYQSDDQVTLFLETSDNQQFELSFHTLSPGFEQFINPALFTFVLDSIALPDTPSKYTFSPKDATSSSFSN